ARRDPGRVLQVRESEPDSAVMGEWEKGIRFPEARGKAMSKFLRLFQVAALSQALCLALLALGCGEQDQQAGPNAQAEGDREAKLKEMALRLKSNSSDRPYVPTGLSLKHGYWVDEERSQETTVGQTLTELGATLRDGKVVDPAGKELYFYSVRDP